MEEFMEQLIFKDTGEQFFQRCRSTFLHGKLATQNSFPCAMKNGNTFVAKQWLYAGALFCNTSEEPKTAHPLTHRTPHFSLCIAVP
jgi:hypothetical protein